MHSVMFLGLTRGKPLMRFQ